MHLARVTRPERAICTSQKKSAIGKSLILNSLNLAEGWHSTCDNTCNPAANEHWRRLFEKQE
jgi:hypothetical protein